MIEEWADKYSASKCLHEQLRFLKEDEKFAWAGILVYHFRTSVSFTEGIFQLKMIIWQRRCAKR